MLHVWLFKMRSLLVVLAFACIIFVRNADAVIRERQPPPDVAVAIYLTEYPSAKCLDGSPYAFYIRQASAGSVNSTKWVFHLQGGGWCSDYATCFGRTKGYLGTSNTSVTNYTNTSEFSQVKCDNKGCGALMLSDPAINAFAYDWNAVFLRYCDGMAFSGNASAPVNGLWFRGLENLVQSFSKLTKDYSLGAATDVILTGSSAGGHAAYLHADRMVQLIHAANLNARQQNVATVVVMPDSGFWPDDPNKRFSSIFTGWFALQGNVTDGLPINCPWRDSQNVTRCLYPQYFAKYIQARLVPVQSLYDPLQNRAPGSDPNEHGKWLLTTMNETILSQTSEIGLRNGGFIYSCSRHCGGSLLTVDGMTLPQATATLWSEHNSSTDKTLWLNDAPYPCSTCCNDRPYPPQALDVK